ncbi:MAG: hypothetical protein R6U00_06225 [Prochlorococcaceae cyanobacterium]
MTVLPRSHDLDWLRLLAVMLLIAYHSAAVFYAGELGRFYVVCPASTPLAGWRQSSWPVRGSDRPQVVAGDNLGAMAVEATRKLSHPIPRTRISSGFF